MSWIQIHKSRNYAALLMLMSTSFCLNATAQTQQFSTASSALYGSVTRTVMGPAPTTTSIAPIASSITQLSGTNDSPLSTASQTIYGVAVYNLSTIDDATLAADTALNDYGTAFASIGTGSLLGGLVTWQSSYTPLVCQPNAVNPIGQVDCNSNAVIANLKINGVAIPAGTYPAGTAFPITGSIPDTSCAAGADAFTGYLITQESQTTGLGTGQVNLSISGLHLVGQGTCEFQGVILFSTTSFDLHLLTAGSNIGGTTNLVVNTTGNLTLANI